MNKCKCDMVKLLTKNHGDVWVCLECKKVSKDVLTAEELDSMIEFIKIVRKEKNEKTIK